MSHFYYHSFLNCIYLFGCTGSLLLRSLFSGGGKQGLLSSSGARASH